MATKRQGKVLYFIKGMKPSEAQLEKAEKLEGLVAFRNVNLFDVNDPIEEGVTHVAGYVPQKYREAKGITVVSTKDMPSGEKTEKPETPEVKDNGGKSTKPADNK